MIKDRKTGYIFKSTDYSVREVLNGKDVLTLYVKEGSEDAKRIMNEMILVEEAYSKSEFVVKKISTAAAGQLEVEADLNTDDFRQSIFVGFSKTGSPYNILNSVVPDGWAVEDHTGISESKTVELDGPTAIGVADSVLSIFNIAIRYDFVRKQQHIYNLDAFEANGEYVTKELNLVSLDRYSDSKDLINRLYARGKDGLTFADINDGKDYVEDTSYLSGKIVSDFIKDDRFESKESLLAYAKETLKSRSKPQSSYECKPVDIGAENVKYAFLKLELMSIVTLLDVDNDRRADHQVVEKVVHPYDKTQNELTLSTKIPTLTEDTSYVSNQINNPNSDFNQKLQSDMDRIASAVIKASGGHVIINFGDDGKMAEILVMDTNDKSTAVNVMRINMGGIAFSTSGYNGPFNGAWGLNGEFFTEFIATWKLSAALVVTGILRSNDGKTFYLDLDNGILKMEADELKIAGKTVESIAQEKADAAQSAASKELADFAETVTSNVDNLQSQIDGQIQTWFYSHVPSADNAPANSWTTTEEKNNHLGDLYYIVDEPTSGGRVYRWALVNDEYKWIIVKDEDTAKALAMAEEAQDTADGKRRVFVAQPVPPYDVGDLWSQGTDGDLMRCNVARTSGFYVADDWGKASKYIDSEEASSIADEAISAQTQEDIFNKLTDNGKLQGFYIQDGKLYINAEFVQILNLVANTITSGILKSKDENTFYLDLDNGILRMQADELTISGKTVAEIAAENGGAERNLLLYSNFVKTKDPFGFGSLQDGVWTYSNIPKDRWTSISLLASDAAKSMRGQKLTFSVKVNTTGIATDGGQYGYAIVNLYAYVKYAGSDSQIRSHIINIDNGETYPSTNGFKLLQVTMQLQDKEITEVGMGLIWQRSSGNISIKEPMLNFGEVAAAYAPAPEDGVNPDANLSQSDVFNRLTNNGQLQGLFMKDGKLYINSSYVSTGIIRSTNGQIQFNLDTGVISCANGSSEVRIREGYFELYNNGVRKVAIGTNHNIYGPQIMLIAQDGSTAYMSSQETDVNGQLYAKKFNLAGKEAKWEWDGNKAKYVLVAE